MIDTIFARVIELNGRDWLLGANWSEPTFLKKPGNLARLAESEGIDPQASLVAFMTDEAQLGFYVFPTQAERPGKTLALAQLFLAQISRRGEPEGQTPLTAILNLGDCYWLVILDAEGNLLPGFERWGTQTEVREFINDPENAGRLNAFRKNRIVLDDPDAAVAWLFEGISKPRVFATPLRSKNNWVPGASLSGGTGGTDGGGEFWIQAHPGTPGGI